MTELDSAFRVFRNWLPQWRLDGGVRFVTWRLALLGDILSPTDRSVVVTHLKKHKDLLYRLAIYVVMDDHVHVLLQTLPGVDLSHVLKLWKGASSHEISQLRGARGSRWQKDSHTEVMRNEAAIMSRREYIFRNPERKWGIDPVTYEWLEWFE